MAPPSLSWCRSLPKVELHAHLSGSISERRILDLINKHGGDGDLLSQATALLSCNDQRPLSQCFNVFSLLHRLLNSRECLFDATTYVLEDYAEDNCRYLELRTTPRELADSTSPLDYILTVMDAVNSFHSRIPTPSMQCRVLVSISRGETIERASETMDLVDCLLQYPQDHFVRGLLVGLDFSGNPCVSNWAHFADTFACFREKHGDRLPLTLHFAETQNDAEAAAMLTFLPRRLGHAFKMSEETAMRLLKLKIPVEVCLTSNLKTERASNMHQHPLFVHLIPARHPYAICCDDCGVFRTSLSEEYHRVANTGGLTCTNMMAVTKTAIRISFADHSLKAKLLAEAEKFNADTIR